MILRTKSKWTKLDVKLKLLIYDFNLNIDTDGIWRYLICKMSIGSTFRAGICVEMNTK